MKTFIRSVIISVILFLFSLSAKAAVSESFMASWYLRHALLVQQHPDVVEHYFYNLDPVTNAFTEWRLMTNRLRAGRSYYIVRTWSKIHTCGFTNSCPHHSSVIVAPPPPGTNYAPYTTNALVRIRKDAYSSLLSASSTNANLYRLETNVIVQRYFTVTLPPLSILTNTYNLLVLHTN